MLKQKKYFIPLIIIYVILISVLVMTAINPGIDYSISDFMTSGGAVTFTIGNTLEIWAEPVPLLPICFILAMCAVYCIRIKEKGILPRLLGLGLAAGGAILSWQIVYRTVKYYCKLRDITQPWTVGEGPFLSDKLWLKLVCAVAGVGIMFLFVFISLKIKQDLMKPLQRMFAFIIIALLAELAVVEGLKLIFGRMRYREWINTLDGYWPWYRLNGKPASDAFKSFPSGHTASAALLLPVTFVLNALGKEKAARYARICTLVWVLIVMTSRIMAGAHFLSDVCAGALITVTITAVTGAIVFRDGKFTKEEK
ncbi:MAG: phosphatase PAP2 family protein [Clostridia bacterium]|nr:phosphatase PAP2 family protein [Clostridia bacterium]